MLEDYRIRDKAREEGSKGKITENSKTPFFYH